MATSELPPSGRDSGATMVEDPVEIVREWLPRIEQMASRLCRRYYLRPEEEEDFRGEVRLKLVDDDYAVVRRFSGRSSLVTYFRVVVTNLFRDWRNHVLGKWRPSAEAIRLGEVAIWLEKLLRDGRTLHEACRELIDNRKVPYSEAELVEIAAKLPPRTHRQFEGEETLENQASREDNPEDQFLQQERRDRRCRVMEALGRARETLPPEDQLIVKLRFERGMSFVDIARGLGQPQRPFYRRVEQILRCLRSALEGEGIRREDIADLLADDGDAEGPFRKPPAGSVQ